MLYLLIKSLQYQCSQLNFVDYPANLSEIQAGLVIQITKDGLNKYLQKNINFSGSYLVQSQIPDITLNIGVFTIQFTDIKIDNYVLPLCDIRFRQNEADFNIKQMSILLKAQFKIMQNTYPYFQDSGPARLNIMRIDLSSVGNLIFDNSCPLHYFVNISSSNLHVDDIDITLDGNLGFIYNSILQLLTNSLKDQFETTLGPLLVSAIMNVADNSLGTSNNYVTNPIYTYFIGFNQQPISSSLDTNFLTINAIGQTQMQDENLQNIKQTPIYGYQNYTYSQYPQFATNDHIQYLLHYLTFQSSFDKMLTQNLIVNNTNMSVRQIDVNQFANLGLSVTIEISDDQNSYSVNTLMQIKADPLFYASNTVNHTLVYVDSIQAIKVFQSGQPIDVNEQLNARIQTVFGEITDATQKCGIQITNSNGINECKTLVINSDWIHVGCILY